MVISFRFVTNVWGMKWIDFMSMLKYSVTILI